jgi:tetratricopeptide (TPR) repeat protein
LIVIRSEPTIAITSERRFSSPRNDYFHGSESARDSRFVGPAFELGKLQLEQKQYAGAMDWFRRVPASDPNYAEARFKIGVAAHSAGQATTAADCFRDVLRSYPVSELYNNLGAAELAGGQSNAADEFRRALDSDPENSTYLFNLGLALYKKPSYEEAAKQLKRLLDKDAADNDAQILLTHAHRHEPGRLESRSSRRPDYDTALMRPPSAN